MACPDELTLDLWLADALPSDEAAVVAAHAAECATCAAAEQAAHALGGAIHAALALDADERRYLARLTLAAPWRTSAAAAPALSWGWIALAGVIGGFAAWMAAAPLYGEQVAAAVEIGLGSVPLSLALDLVFNLGRALFRLTQLPALGLAQPLLALVALALLLWPRQLIPQRRTLA
jgi:hypothetical protein